MFKAGLRFIGFSVGDLADPGYERPLKYAILLPYRVGGFREFFY